jgi:hypothetical protein
MPNSLVNALHFLETQWSSINQNKVKGILSEVRFKTYLTQNQVHFIKGGWIISPGKNTFINPPTRLRICVIPVSYPFSWSMLTSPAEGVLPAQASAKAYFNQVGIRTFFARPIQINQTSFQNPIKGNYPTDYQIEFLEINHQGQFIPVPFSTLMAGFPNRNGLQGLRCYQTGRLSPVAPPWNDPATVTDLFWFEYVRYYIQCTYLVSNNDLDLFLVGNSGASYPIELKSKPSYRDSSFGDWFGLDAGPFAKLAFFSSRSMNMDALYIVEEIDSNTGNPVALWGIKFSDLLGCCSWVPQPGGQGMGGGRSSTYKIPKVSFTPVAQLLAQL